MKARKNKTSISKSSRGKARQDIKKSRAGLSAKSTHKTNRRIRRQNYPIHKRLLLHPLTIFGLLCAGVLIAGWTYRVLADTVISSVIEAPALSEGATITSPNDGSRLTSSPINVLGTCPDSSYIKLYLNSVFDGVGWCGPDNTFSIQTSLFSGTNTLLAQDYNETDLQGPVTPSVQISYSPPAVATTPSNPKTASPSETSTRTSAPAQSALPLLISSDFQFKTFSANKAFDWELKLEGGTPPYLLRVQWGDGTTSILHFATDPVFTITHNYKLSGYFAVIIAATDSAGQLKTFQVAALITNSAGTIPGVSNSSNKPIQQSILVDLVANIKQQQWLLVAWPAYLTILLMTVSFWLGEKREYSSPKTR